MRKLNAVDGLLLAVILLSLAFISFHLLPKQTTSSFNTVRPIAERAPSPTREVENTRISPETTRDFKNVGADDWNSLIARSRNILNSVTKSAGCESRSPVHALPVISPALSALIVNGRINFFTGFQRQLCFQVGQRIELVEFNDTDLDAPAAKILGSIAVRQIAELRSDDVSADILNVLGLTPAQYRALSADKSYGETILLFDSFQASSKIKTKFAPPVFPLTTIISKEEGLRLAQAGVTAIDVRTPGEFSSSTKEYQSVIRNVPYKMQQPFDFDINRKARALNSDQFQIDLVLNLLKESKSDRLIVFEGEPSDGRAYWALFSIKSLPVTEILWARDVK